METAAGELQRHLRSAGQAGRLPLLEREACAGTAAGTTAVLQEASQPGANTEPGGRATVPDAVPSPPWSSCGGALGQFFPTRLGCGGGYCDDGGRAMPRR